MPLPLYIPPNTPPSPISPPVSPHSPLDNKCMCTFKMQCIGYSYPVSTARHCLNWISPPPRGTGAPIPVQTPECNRAGFIGKGEGGNRELGVSPNIALRWRLHLKGKKMPLSCFLFNLYLLSSVASSLHPLSHFLNFTEVLPQVVLELHWSTASSCCSNCVGSGSDKLLQLVQPAQL